MDDTSETRELFITGLKNAHAMESQALSIMRPQVNRIRSYPDVAQRMEQHIAETEGQIQRLETLLEACGESKSALKDTALSLAGGMAAIGHSAAGDEILKDAFADYAFENYEIAAYNSLITMSEAAGEQAAVDPLRKNLEEEEAMASWLRDNLKGLTMQFVSNREIGETAKI